MLIADIDQIKDVITQTDTITHFTAEFQKVVFSSYERKTLTNSGKFRKRKLDRVVLGQLNTTKPQAIVELSIFLFGVTEKDKERVKYQLKQAIDEKNHREFYCKDRGSKRPSLMNVNLKGVFLNDLTQLMKQEPINSELDDSLNENVTSISEELKELAKKQPIRDYIQ